MASRRVDDCARSGFGRRLVAIMMGLILTLTSVPLLVPAANVAAATPEMDWTHTQNPSLIAPSMAYDAVTKQLIVFGGTDPTGNYSAATWAWDGTMWTDVSPETSPSARDEAGMAYDAATGKVVLFGGLGNSGDLGDTWEWDGTSWTEVTPAAPAVSPPVRSAMNMAYDASTGKVVLYGGFGANGFLNDTWEWDGTSWTDVTPTSPALSPSLREHAAMAYDGKTGEVILFGGQYGGTNLADTWAWDGSSWTEVTPAAPAVSPPPRVGASMAYDESTEQIILFGEFTDTWAWDGSSWSEVTPAAPAVSPPPRVSAAMAYDGSSGQVILLGGTSSNGMLTGTWAWDGSSWAEVASGAVPASRSASSMAYDASRQQVVLFGGVGDVGDLGDTWVWDGASWSDVTPTSDSPSARQSASMAYDASTGKVVLFGGYGQSGMLSDTWVWDGSAWTNVTPSSQDDSPPARDYASMAYDAATGKVVLFGGYDGAKRFGDTWTWDGTSWTNVTPTSQDASPPARNDASMAYDGARQAMVLFGGYGSAGLLNDTWTWDGSDWTSITPTTKPASRQGASMVYDATTEQVILFGGSAASTFFNDTWAWNGSDWTTVTTAHQPSERASFSMAYDAAADQIVLFGGNKSGIRFGDTWLLQETDRIAPTTIASATTADAENYAFGSWTNQAVTVTLDAVDNDGGSGVAGTFYIIDTGDEQPYNGPFTITAAGDHTLTYWSVDNANHAETAQIVQVKIDLTKPTTSASATTAAHAAYSFGNWTNQAVTVALSATDDTDGSGAASTFYTIDSAPQQTYGNPFIVDGNGDHVITYWSTDNAGNVEPAQTAHVKIDTVDPTVTYSGNAGSYTVDQTIDMTCTPADDRSGVASTTCADISGPASSFDLGLNTFSASATDNAGNVGTGSVSFTIGVTPASLCQLTAQFESNSRMASRLCAPLRFVNTIGGPFGSRQKSSFVNAYIVLVNTQRDLSRQEKALLIRYARAL